MVRASNVPDLGVAAGSASAALVVHTGPEYPPPPEAGQPLLRPRRPCILL